MIKYIPSITYSCFVRNIPINSIDLFIMNLLNTVLNIFFPVKCIYCDKEGLDLCLECLSSCSQVKNKSDDWIFPIYDYQQMQIKRAIWLLKYKNRKNIAKVFSQIMYGRIIEELSELEIFSNFNKPILIPIPISINRKKERGYNQSELICSELIKIDKNILLNKQNNFELEKDVLIKTKDLKHQVLTRNRKERFINLKNSFSVENLDVIKNRNIILIDDVVTTGATLNEARRVLLKNGAKKIIAFTVAH